MLEIIFRNALKDKVDPRRRFERNDARMIYEDHTAMANCPPEPIYHTFDVDKDVERLKMYG